MTITEKLTAGKKLTAAQYTRTLVQSLRVLEHQINVARAKVDRTKADADYIAVLELSRSWILSELETRYTAASQAVEDALLAARVDELLYRAALIAAIPASDR
jgi:hypothetical protein